MSDLFSSEILNTRARVLVTRDLRDQAFVEKLKHNGFQVEEFENARIQTIESAIVVCYPGKGKQLDEKLAASSFLVIFDADDALERLMTSRCFFLDSHGPVDIQSDLFDALDTLLEQRKIQLEASNRVQQWEEKVQEALSGFEYLVKSLPMHQPGDISQDEGLADLLDFFVRVLVFKERSVSITSEKSFWEMIVTTFPEFSIEIGSKGTIPIGNQLWNAKEKKESKYSLLKIMGLAFLASEFSEQMVALSRQQREEKLWEEALSKLPHPVALISGAGDLVAHNAAFSQLAIFPADCLKLRSQEKVETTRGIFRLERIRLEEARGEHEEALYVFLFRDDGGSKIRGGSGEELGIISSSIAHELNNPLAGILATLAVLELEDGLNDECLNAIGDMKRSAKRCKELVEIFLGFSRANPLTLGEAQSAIDAFDKAISLSRFRMIENNLRFDIEEVFTASFHRQTNTSILAMVWYLILAEILTSHSHHNLVAGTNTSSIKGKILEKELSLELVIDGDFDWGERVMNSKLLIHLIELAGLSILLEGNKLVLRDWTLT